MGMRKQPEHGYTEFTPEMALLDPEMRKMDLNNVKAACTARNTENDKNKQTCYEKSTDIVRAAIPVGID